MATRIPIWPGAASFFPGDTPFELYDTDKRKYIRIWGGKDEGEYFGNTISKEFSKEYIKES